MPRVKGYHTRNVSGPYTDFFPGHVPLRTIWFVGSHPLSIFKQISLPHPSYLMSRATINGVLVVFSHCFSWSYPNEDNYSIGSQPLFIFK